MPDAARAARPERKRLRHPIDYSARLGQVVKRLRHEQDMSQEALADLAGLDRTYVSMLERGLHRVSLEIAAAVARALNMPLARLVEQLEQEPPRQVKQARKTKKPSAS